MSDRPEPALVGTELEALTGFLDFLRATVFTKTDGLSDEQLRATLPTSSMTLAGMLRHLAFVEDYWMGWVWSGEENEPWAGVDWAADGDWDWNSAVSADGDSLREELRRAQDASRAKTPAGLDLDELAAKELRSGPVNRRYILVHLIEEYARHCGHADVLAEAIDGRTGE